QPGRLSRRRVPRTGDLPQNRVLPRHPSCSRSLPLLPAPLSRHPCPGTPAPAPLPRHRAAASPAQDGAPASSPRMHARERPRHAPAAQTVRMPRGKHFAIWLRSAGHVSHTSAAYEHGFTKRDIAEAVASCGVARVRRSWLTTLSPAAPTRRALAIGGRLTCVSEAHRLGLWVPEASEPHVWVAPNAGRLRRAGMRIHRAGGPAPVARHAPREPLVNVLFQVARCLKADDALTVWESAVRTTSLTKEMLQEVPWRSTRVRRLSDATGGLSDSGLETHVVIRLRRAGLEVRQQVWLDGHPVDVLVGRRLV